MQKSQLISDATGEPIFKFENLPSDTAKQRVREWYVQHWLFDDWAEFYLDDAKAKGRTMGFEIQHIYYSGFWSQGDGASWIGDIDLYKFVNESLPESIGRDCWLWLMQDGWVHDKLAVYQGPSNYYHSGTMSIGNVEVYDANPDNTLNANCILKGAPIQTLWDLIMSDTDCPIKGADDLEELALEKAREYADDIYKRLEKGYEESTSDEEISYALDANDIYFDEYGERSEL